MLVCMHTKKVHVLYCIVWDGLLLIIFLLLNHYIIAKAKLEGASSQIELGTTGQQPHVGYPKPYAVTRREVSMQQI